jgi:hypothetical protein
MDNNGLSMPFADRFVRILGQRCLRRRFVVKHGPGAGKPFRFNLKRSTLKEKNSVFSCVLY